MAQLDRVPGPRSPLEGGAGWVAAIVGIALVLAIAKPWGDGSPTAIWSPPPTTSGRPAALTDGAGAVSYDPAAYPVEPPPAAWAIVTTEGAVPLDFLAREAGQGGDGIGSTADTIVSGPVVPVGAGGPLVSLAIAHPAETEIRAVRLWRLDDGREPVRIELGPVAAPWPDAPVTVLARPAEGALELVRPWDPGLYRLDLLIGPDVRARSVMLTVHGTPMAGQEAAEIDRATIERARGGRRFLDPMLALLPARATLWSAGAVLTGWNRDGSSGACRVVDVWQATAPDARCWPTPLGPTTALGVNLSDVAVDAISLKRLDPLPGTVATTNETAVQGRPGLAVVRVQDGRLPDGVYRLEARVTGGAIRIWHVEVGPIGRAVARLNEASTSR